MAKVFRTTPQDDDEADDQPVVHLDLRDEGGQPTTEQASQVANFIYATTDDDE
ncbi:hypothetical protein H7J77_17130 [Mycolicibacillus parakoreensis]|uniref:Uncharacterized protein n=1 Tax=Mycolicibacillus parakoreensis TaxID=1069221 RepID=A0ABY3TUZ4_9MYCO|nr:hypothetical protein [Mycolicibacillus parakoreensis]MCV7317260.1 hypothetical protein [Mycolicibacillus parakoreensis]ULN51528.1 hypothetical protein MIU77_11480 [Mycolicibacillus parakoreensis]